VIVVQILMEMEIMFSLDVLMIMNLAIINLRVKVKTLYILKMKMQNIILICLMKVVNVIAMKIVLMIKDVLDFHLADGKMKTLTMRKVGKVLYVL